jgi:hypothetical protein
MNDFQDEILDWTVECFGKDVARDTKERNYRFIEESLELVQSLGATKEDCHKLVDYVFGRDKGEPTQELGGTLVTLAALANANNLNLQDCAWDERDRVWAIKDKIKAKWEAKQIKSNPLPV